MELRGLTSARRPTSAGDHRLTRLAFTASFPRLKRTWNERNTAFAQTVPDGTMSIDPAVALLLIVLESKLSRKLKEICSVLLLGKPEYWRHVRNSVLPHTNTPTL